MNKKIPYILLTYSIMKASFIGISSKYLFSISKEDSIITIFLLSIIGLIPLYLIYKFITFKKDITVKDKIILLQPKIYPLTLFFLFIIFFFLSLINYCNLVNIISIEFLNKTPKWIIGFTILIPITYILNKKDIIIPRVATILSFTSLILFIMTIIGVCKEIDINNLKPLLQTNNYIPIIPMIGLHIIPIMLINNENIKCGYFFGIFSILILTFITLSVLGINFVNIYEYPVFQLLKRAYNHRAYNILAIQWILDIYLYIVVSINFCKKIFNTKYLSLILFIISLLLFNFSSTFIINLIYSFQYIIVIAMLIILLILNIKIKKVDKSTL